MKDIVLYHGSRGGIVGYIAPCSRVRCDFGKGFYMGTKPEQAKTLVYTDTSPVFYTLNLKMSELDSKNIVQLEGMDWAYFVLYNRGRLEKAKDSDFYKRIANIGNNADMIVGPIAEDNMNMIMRQFSDGDITDVAFMECIKCIDYGTQYVAKTEKACSCIDIQLEEILDASMYDEYRRYSDDRKRESESKVQKIKRQFRNEGKYLDELLNDFSDDSMPKKPGE